MPPAVCLLSLELILVFVLVVIFFNDIQFDRVESDELQIGSAFLARKDIALICVRIDVDIRVAFGACSGWHFLYLQRK